MLVLSVWRPLSFIGELTHALALVKAGGSGSYPTGVILFAIQLNIPATKMLLQKYTIRTKLIGLYILLLRGQHSCVYNHAVIEYSFALPCAPINGLQGRAEARSVRYFKFQ